MRLRFLIALLALAITVQNTCPYGYAGKSAVAAPYVHTCPLKDRLPAMPGGRNTVESNFQDLDHPFILVSAPVGVAFQLSAPAREPVIIMSPRREDIFPDPPHRPPEI